MEVDEKPFPCSREKSFELSSAVGEGVIESGGSVYQCAAGATTAPAGPATTAAPTGRKRIL